jgi:hypothetical protein
VVQRHEVANKTQSSVNGYTMPNAPEEPPGRHQRGRDRRMLQTVYQCRKGNGKGKTPSLLTRRRLEAYIITAGASIELKKGKMLEHQCRGSNLGELRARLQYSRVTSILQQPNAEFESTNSAWVFFPIAPEFPTRMHET